MKSRYPCILIFILSATFCHTTLWAQPADSNLPIGSTRQDTIPSGIMPLDTLVPMTYVLIGDPATLHTLADTFQWEDNKHYPLPGYYAHLGNYGSAARSLAPEWDAPLGFSTGWLQYEPYYVHDESFRYYNQDVPVADIKYSQAGQEDTYLTLDFGRSFAKGLSLSVSYKRINQIGEFLHQRQKDTGFGIGIWHHAPNGRYDAFYSYVNNSAITQENGGVSDIDSIGQPRWPDMSIPVYLSNSVNDNSAVSSQKHRSFLTRQIVHILPDSTGLSMDLWLKASFSTGLFKYVDEDILPSAAEYYGSAYLLDQRGIRQYTYLQENNWSGGVTLPWKAAHSKIDASMRYRGIQLEQEPEQRTIHEVYFEANGVFQWVEPLILKGELSLGLGQAEGIFAFKAGADLNLRKLGHLLGYWSAGSRKPYLVESKLFVSQLPVYDFEYRNPFMNEIGVTWDLRKQQLQAGVQWLVFDNYIYFDSLSFPRQIEESFSLRRVTLTKRIEWEHYGVKGSAFWQPDPRAELALPEWWFTASTYGTIRIMDKKVTLIPGVDVTYNGGYTGISYFPINGSYHLTDGPEVNEAFRIDAGLGLQIKFLRAFFRMEDMVGLFKDRALFQANYYPIYHGYFRFGLEASFFN